MSSPISGKVCFCNGNKAWGGGERWHLEAALAMAEKGLDVAVMAGAGTPLLERARRYPQLTCLPFRFSTLSSFNPFMLLFNAATLKYARVSHLVLGLTSDIKGAGLAGKMAGVKKIIYRRGSALSVRNDALNKLYYRKILDGVIVNSRATEILLLAECPDLIPQEKIHLLYNGLDAEAFDAMMERGETLSAVYEREKKTLIIGNAARLTEQKGQKYLLHMSKALSEAGLAHKVVIAGDGPGAGALLKLSKQLGVEEHVIFLGFREDLANFWKSIDIFVLPSLWEGFGYVLAEAMLAEKPLLGFYTSSMPELVREGINGSLIARPDPKEPDAEVGQRLAEAITAMAADKKEIKAMGRRGRQIVLEEFNQKQCMERLYNLLTS